MDTLRILSKTSPVAKELFKRVQYGKVPGALLLHGPPGCGKTSSIEALCTALRPKLCISMNASDDRGVSAMRTAVSSLFGRLIVHPDECHGQPSWAAGGQGTPALQNAPTKDSRRVLFLDEADGLTDGAQEVLAATLSALAARRASHCFVFATANHPRKIAHSVVSHMVRLHTPPLRGRDAIEVVRTACEAGMVRISDAARDTLLKCSGRDTRAMLSVVHNVSNVTMPENRDDWPHEPTDVRDEVVAALTPAVDPWRLATAVMVTAKGALTFTCASQHWRANAVEAWVDVVHADSPADTPRRQFSSVVDAAYAGIRWAQRSGVDAGDTFSALRTAIGGEPASEWVTQLALHAHALQRRGAHNWLQWIRMVCVLMRRASQCAPAAAGAP